MWTTIPKPVGTPYTNVNTVGKQQYDEPTLMYDDSSTFYDGTDMFAYTMIPKPTGDISMSGGMTQGLLIPLTKQTTISSSPWTKVSKPSN